jgi:hypothetical protein
MIPNRDSTPQNQPRPKEAVSKTDGAAASMGGIVPDWVSVVSARLMASSCLSMAQSVLSISHPAFASIVGATPNKIAIIPNNNHSIWHVKYLLIILVPPFIICNNPQNFFALKLI